MLVGNDVVDLREAIPTRKERDPRFLERVFTPLEREHIGGAENPPLALWMLWAAKESLFKVAAKLEPGTVFAHEDFSLKREQLERLRPAAPTGGKLGLTVMYRHYRVELRWEWSPDHVHCLATWGDVGSWVARVARAEEIAEGALSAREEESAHSPESRKVRLLAKRLLRETAPFLRRPEVVRRRESSSRFLPPVVLESGNPACGTDLSLSHDGRFLAAVLSY